MKKNKKTILIVIAILLISTLLTVSIIFGRNFAKKFNEKTNNQNEIKEESKKEENNEQQENNGTEDKEEKNEQQENNGTEEKEEQPEKDEIADKPTEDNSNPDYEDDKLKELFDYKLKVYSGYYEDDPFKKNYISYSNDGRNKILSPTATLVLEIEVESKDAKIYDVGTTQKKEYYEYAYYEGDLTYVLYEDNGLKLYDVKRKITTKINLDYDNYELHMSYDGNKAHGITFSNINHSNQDYYYGKENINWGYYNLTTNKKMYENEYDIIYSPSGDYIEGIKFHDDYYEKIEETPDSIMYDSFALNISDAKNINFVSTERYWNGPNLSTKKYNNKYYYLQADGDDTGPRTWATIYSNSGKKISTVLDELWSTDKNGYLYIVKDNKVEKYNIDGKLISSSKEYPKIICNSGQYIIYIENSEIKITDFENNFTKKVAYYDYTEDDFIWSEEYLEQTNTIQINFAVFSMIYNVNTRHVEIIENTQ